MENKSIIRKYVIGGVALVALIIIIGFFGITRNSAKRASLNDPFTNSEQEKRSATKDSGVASLLQYSDLVNGVNGQVMPADTEDSKNLLDKLHADGIAGDSVFYKVMFLGSDGTTVSDEVNLQVSLKLPEDIISSSGDTLTAYYATADGYSVLSSYIMDGAICCELPAGGTVAVVKSTNSIFANVDVSPATLYTNDAATVRTGADVSFEAKKTLETGTEVEVVGKVRDSEWYLVKTSEGYGYIRQDLLSESKTTSKPAQAATNKNKTTTNTQTKTNSTEPSDAEKQRQLDLETQKKIEELQQIAIQQSMAENAASAPAAETPVAETPAPVAETPVETPASAPTPETPSE